MWRGKIGPMCLIPRKPVEVPVGPGPGPGCWPGPRVKLPNLVWHNLARLRNRFLGFYNASVRVDLDTFLRGILNFFPYRL